MINEKEISFIICYNQKAYLDECLLYINQLEIPPGYCIATYPIFNADSMAAGYNLGMTKAPGKYKVYLHQDVFIINKSFLFHTITLFQNQPDIGLIGMVGTKRLPPNGCMWSTPMRSGALRSCTLNTTDDFFDIPISPKRQFTPVQAIDGLLMMTQYDIPWREDLFTGWDFYDVSQSLEFTKAGYKVVVPYQETPWVIHDCGFMNLKNYHFYRKIFLKEYFPNNTNELEDCNEKILEWQTKVDNTKAVITKLFSLLNNDNYSMAKTFAFDHLQENQENYDYCILFLFLQIYDLESSQGKAAIFAPLSSHTCDWLLLHYQRIKHYIWRFAYEMPEDSIEEAKGYFIENTVSEIALKRIRELVL